MIFDFLTGQSSRVVTLRSRWIFLTCDHNQPASLEKSSKDEYASENIVVALGCHVLKLNTRGGGGGGVLVVRGGGVVKAVGGGEEMVTCWKRCKIRDD